MEGEKRVIKPTVGRVVLYWPDGPAMKEGGQQPHAAVVAFVHDDRKVNLATFDQYGKPGAVTSAVLRQPDDVIATGAFAEWMECQIGQAAKTEDAAGKFAKRVEEIDRETNDAIGSFDRRLLMVEEKLAKALTPVAGDHLTEALAQADRDNPVKSG